MAPAARRGPAALAELERLESHLRDGARVADVRCGDGRALVALAKAFPRSTFHGFESEPAPVRAARRAAAGAGVSDRVTFEVAPAGAIPADGYDLLVDAHGLAVLVGLRLGS